ncbi:MAG: hypothetical protein ABF318_06575, partial [Ketobacter sp.]
MRAMSGLAFFLLLPALATAADDDFLGNWLLQVQEGRAEMQAVLSIVQTDQGLMGYVENSPIELQVEGNSIRMRVDDWGRAGGRIERHYRGQLVGAEIRGEFGPDFELDEEDAYICKVSSANC